MYVDGVSRSSLAWSGSPGAPSDDPPAVASHPNAPRRARLFPGVDAKGRADLRPGP